MHSIEQIIKINGADHPPPHPLYWHPRIAALRHSVNHLPVQDEYRKRLRAALYRYADQFVERPYYKPEEGWDNLESLQQVTLGDWTEEGLRQMAERFTT
jgi:hypothetical protein